MFGVKSHAALETLFDPWIAWANCPGSRKKLTSPPPPSTWSRMKGATKLPVSPAAVPSMSVTGPMSTGRWPKKAGSNS
jgi:hypothetical protein